MQAQVQVQPQAQHLSRATHQDMPSLPSSSIKSDPDLEREVNGTMDTDTPTSPDGCNGRAGSVVSMEDPDVRIAAEALGDLRAGEWP